MAIKGRTRKPQSEEEPLVDILDGGIGEYQKYLLSTHWFKTKESALRRGGYKCALCGRGKEEIKLEVHHNTYINKGDELPEDIVVLCEKHHAFYHFIERLENK